MRLAVAIALLPALALPPFVSAVWAQTAQKPAAPKAQPRQDPVAASYAALTEQERTAIQTDLIWVGDYNGTASADFGPRAIAAVKAFQKRNGTKETGVLNPKERGILSAAARKKREAVGWRMVDDGATGARIGIPSKLVPQHAAIIGGARWSSARGEVQVDTFRIAAPGTTLQSVYEAQRKVSERKVSYNLARNDFFVVSGLQGLKKLYVRGQFKDGQVRGFSIAYDQAMEGTLDPIVIAMSSAFQAFPAGAMVAAPPPPPRRKVEYGTGVFVSTAGHAVTTRDLIDGCQTFNLSGYGPADLVAQDKEAGLALLRVYGARDLKPLALADDVGASEVTLIGIADPERQNGGASVSTAPAKLAPAAAGQRAAIEPTPALGFAGAAAVDRSGRLLGVADVSIQVVAGPPPAPAAHATLIPAATVKTFLAAQKVEPATTGVAGAEAAKASVARVICVRK